MLKKWLVRVILIIYVLFSIGFIIVNYPVLDIYDIIGTIISLVCVFGITKIKRINNKIFVIVLLVGLLLRLALCFFPYQEPINDYAYFYSDAINFANKSQLRNLYIALFSYLYFYVSTLGLMMRIFGKVYTTVIVLNIVIEALGGYLFYLISRNRYGDNTGRIALLFYAINPVSLLWINKCCPVIIVNTLLLLIIYIYDIVNKDFNKKNIFLALLLGLVMSIANHYRPIIIIFVITIVLMCIMKIITEKKDWLKHITILLCILIPYTIFNCTFDKIISSQIQYKLPESRAGWSIYVGANNKHNGRWDQDDSEHFMSLANKFGPAKAQKMVQKEGILRYKSLGIKSLILFMAKSVVLGGGLPNYTYTETVLFIDYKISKPIEAITRSYIYSYIFVILFLNLLTAVKSYREKKFRDDNLMLYIFIIGLFSSMLLVEVSERYYLPIFTIIMISSISYFKGIEN